MWAIRCAGYRPRRVWLSAESRSAKCSWVILVPRIGALSWCKHGAHLPRQGRIAREYSVDTLGLFGSQHLEEPRNATTPTRSLTGSVAEQSALEGVPNSLSRRDFGPGRHRTPHGYAAVGVYATLNGGAQTLLSTVLRPQLTPTWKLHQMPLSWRRLEGRLVDVRRAMMAKFRTDCRYQARARRNSDQSSITLADRAGDDNYHGPKMAPKIANGSAC